MTQTKMDRNDMKGPENGLFRNDIVLASASPRRREMFEERGIPFRICPADVDEELPMDMAPEVAVMYLAYAKATDVAKRETGLIIAADTIVVYDGRIIGKPVDEDDAFRILSELRGNRHQVMTGVCLIDNSMKDETIKSEPIKSEPIKSEPIKTCLYEVTDVYFRDYSDEELRAYVKTPEPYDKAGGYAIQESFGKYIDHIDGDRDNVIGFPMYRVEGLLLENPAQI